MNTLILDTNIILRFLRKDNLVFYKRAKLIFNRAGEGKILLYLDELVAAEIVWTLQSFYKQFKQDVVEVLLDLASQDWIINPRKQILLETLRLYRGVNLSYVDCWLVILSRESRIKLETFDSKLQKTSKNEG